MTTKPYLATNPDLTDVYDLAKEVVDDVWGDDTEEAVSTLEDADRAQLVYETLMTALFGPDFWDKYNARSQDLGV